MNVGIGVRDRVRTSAGGDEEAVVRGEVGEIEGDQAYLVNLEYWDDDMGWQHLNPTQSWFALEDLELDQEFDLALSSNM